MRRSPHSLLICLGKSAIQLTACNRFYCSTTCRRKKAVHQNRFMWFGQTVFDTHPRRLLAHISSVLISFCTIHFLLFLCFLLSNCSYQGFPSFGIYPIFPLLTNDNNSSTESTPKSLQSSLTAASRFILKARSSFMRLPSSKACDLSSMMSWLLKSGCFFSILFSENHDFFIFSNAGL